MQEQPDGQQRRRPEMRREGGKDRKASEERTGAGVTPKKDGHVPLPAALRYPETAPHHFRPDTGLRFAF
jgi:hypothetical protein